MRPAHVNDLFDYSGKKYINAQWGTLYKTKNKPIGNIRENIK